MKILKKNKRAFLDYDIKERFIAGIVLQWFEVKSIKTWNIDMRNSLAYIRNNEVWLGNLNVPMYSKTNPDIFPDYQSKRTRKLLMKKREIWRLAERTKKTWLVLIALAIWLSRGKIKIELGLGKLRKKIEKKQIKKEKDIMRDAKREMKNY